MSAILVVEDDNDINAILSRIVRQAGYDAVSAYSGTEALLQFERCKPCLVLLDLMLPGLSGREVLEKLRGEYASAVPVIVLSAKGGLGDKVSLLDTGADDYIVKPFEPQEVLARMRSALRRAGSVQERAEQPLTYKNIALFPDIRKVTVCGGELVLTSIEYDLLLTFMRNPEKVYSRQKLYEEVWKDGYYGTDHTVNVHVSNLRKKIKELDEKEDYIQSVYGIGFRLAKS